ncbi:hypothetical protein PG1821B_1590 [Bifidobacterium animalis subsp. lactis]|nr:hypothetical protein PG1821B_1590 [Bifidobacterium animalis subsp. lactis]
MFIADTATNKLYVFTYYEGLSIILVRFFTEFKQLVLNGMRNLCRNLHIYRFHFWCYVLCIPLHNHCTRLWVERIKVFLELSAILIVLPMF